MLDELAEATENEYGFNRRVEIYSSLRDQRKILEDSITTVEQQLAIGRKEQALLADRMGQFYSELCKQRVRERVLACFEDYQKLRLELEDEALEDFDEEKISLLNVRLIASTEAVTAIDMSMAREMDNLLQQMIRNEYATQSEIRKIGIDWEELNLARKELRQKETEIVREQVIMKVEMDAASDAFKQRIAYEVQRLLGEYKMTRAKQDELQATLRSQEAMRERKYDELRSTYERVCAAANERTKMVKARLTEIMQEWAFIERDLNPALVNRPINVSFDAAISSSQKSTAAWDNIKEIAPRMLNEKKYRLWKEYRKYNEQLILEKATLKRVMIGRKLFIRHQKKRALMEEDTSTLYILEPIEVSQSKSLEDLKRLTFMDLEDERPEPETPPELPSPPPETEENKQKRFNLMKFVKKINSKGSVRGSKTSISAEPQPSSA